jgi:hypothetical protein
MRKQFIFGLFLLAAAAAMAQSSAPVQSSAQLQEPTAKTDQLVIPAGTKVPVALKAGILHEECPRRRSGIRGNDISCGIKQPHPYSCWNLHSRESDACTAWRPL